MKSKMKKHGIQWIAFMLVVIMMFMLAACGNKDQSQNPEPVESNAQTEPVTGPVENTDAESKILVIYFSWSGNLHKMAGWVADETGGDLIRVTAKEAYPDDYDATADRAKQEQEDGVRPEINVDLTAEQLAQYDVVFFGFPVWWYDLPMPMWTLLENYDFSGKTIIPFFSHEGSSNGANALPTVTELAGDATVRTEDALSIRGGNVAGSEEDVRGWVRDLGYSK